MSVQDPREDRLSRVLLRMDELGVDALLLSHGADLPWLTGYRAMPLERITVLVVRRAAEPVLLVPELEALRVPSSDGLFSMRAWKESEDPISLVCALLETNRSQTIAVSDRAWVSTLLDLQAGMSAASWLKASSVTGALRAVKDEEETRVLRAASRAADGVAQALQKGEIPLIGRTESEVSEEISMRLLAEGHQSVNFAIVGSGPNAASPHHHAGPRRIGPGEVVVCDFGGSLALPGVALDVGYCSDITRTVVTGEPGDKVRDHYEILKTAQKAAVDAVAPGVCAGDVDRAARDPIERQGLGDLFIHRTGHGIGIEEHEDPYVVSGSDEELRPGHAFSIEPGLYLPGEFGMRLEDIVMLTEDGSDSLNVVDHSLCVVEA